MYVEPRDAIRGYVQNAFDAIRSSRDGSVALQAPPRIDIVVSESGDGFIQIRDNGASITAERVWETLTSIGRSEEHTSELQSLMRISYAVFCLKNKNHK